MIRHLIGITIVTISSTFAHTAMRSYCGNIKFNGADVFLSIPNHAIPEPGYSTDYHLSDVPGRNLVQILRQKYRDNESVCISAMSREAQGNGFLALTVHAIEDKPAKGPVVLGRTMTMTLVREEAIFAYCRPDNPRFQDFISQHKTAIEDFLRARGFSLEKLHINSIGEKTVSNSHLFDYRLNLVNTSGREPVGELTISNLITPGQPTSQIELSFKEADRCNPLIGS